MSLADNFDIAHCIWGSESSSLGAVRTDLADGFLLGRETVLITEGEEAVQAGRIAVLQVERDVQDEFAQATGALGTGGGEVVERNTPEGLVGGEQVGVGEEEVVAERLWVHARHGIRVFVDKQAELGQKVAGVAGQVERVRDHGRDCLQGVNKKKKKAVRGKRP